MLNTIHENYDYIEPQSNIILQLHRDLYTYSSSAMGGKYKASDNTIEEIDIDGNKKIRFIPVPAYMTKDAMENLCNEYLVAAGKNEIDPLLLMPIFILDFLCIHPFHDGNGRMSRLLTLLLLYKNNYIVGKYISIETLIEKTRESYYLVLQKSSHGWHENSNDYIPFIKYYLGIVLGAYREFSSRIDIVREKNLSKPERVKHVFSTKIGRISKSDIASLCPDISITTIEKALSGLLKEGFIKKVGGGRSTGYVVNAKD